MKTHEEKTQQHIDAICDVFKKEPERILYMGVKPDTITFQFLHREPFNYSIAKPAIAPGNNPDGLTVEQVPAGERLLEEDEIKPRGHDGHIKMWAAGDWADNAFGALDSSTYRTRLSREQLALLDKQEGWIPWFGDGEIPTGVMDVIFNNGERTDLRNSKSWNMLTPFHWGTHVPGHRIIAYRPVKTEPKVVPRDCAADVPAVCWMRSKAERQWTALVVMVNDSRVSFACESHSGIAPRTYAELVNYEYSTDRINWFPCTKEETK